MLIDKLSQKRATVYNYTGGHTTLEDTDIAITLDTNNQGAPHPQSNMSSFIEDPLPAM
jgi:hypothetical protein